MEYRAAAAADSAAKLGQPQQLIEPALLWAFITRLCNNIHNKPALGTQSLRSPNGRRRRYSLRAASLTTMTPVPNDDDARRGEYKI